MQLPPIKVPDGTETREPALKEVPSIKDAVERRQNEPFFTVLPRPQYPACDHRRRGVRLDAVTRTVECLCGAHLDPFDALLIYADSEKRLVRTREDIEAHKREEAEKAAELKARKPFLRRVGAFSAVFRPQPPNGDGAIYAYDVSLDCGHTLRWPTKGRRSPGRHLTCEICVRIKHREMQAVAKDSEAQADASGLLVSDVEPKSE